MRRHGHGKRVSGVANGTEGGGHADEAGTALVERVATLAQERFAPRAARYDAEARFPVENYDDLHAAGLLGLVVPTVYGGCGADPLTYALCLVEIARGCSATALTFNMHSTVLGILAALASPAQRQRYFGAVVREGRRIASITSEPESSFRDRAVLQTVFEPVPGGYRVRGLKQFCSLGDAADYYLVSGLCAGSATAREGILSAMIPAATPGITVERPWNAVGMRGTISHTLRYDCVVAEADVIGEPGGLLTVDLTGFALGYAATYLGIGEAAFAYVREYARTKTVQPAGTPLSHDPLVQRTLGELSTTLRAARLLLCDAARTQMAGDPAAAALAVNQAKYYAAEVGAQVAERALRLVGGRGILADLPLERWRRDALAGPVMPPSNDRCLATIGRLLCGLEAATLEFA